MPFFRKKKEAFDASAFDGIMEGVKKIYREKIRPVEEQYMVNAFHYPLLNDRDYDSRPMILLSGNYATRKTSCIKCLSEQESQGRHSGPEPTTDRCQAIMHGVDERVLPGHALVSDPTTPYFELPSSATRSSRASPAARSTRTSPRA